MPSTVTKALVALSLFAGLWPAVASGHDFLLKPETGTVAAGKPLTVHAMLTEVYFKGDVIAPADKTPVTLRAGGKSVAVPMQPDEAAKTLRGSVPAAQCGDRPGTR